MKILKKIKILYLILRHPLIYSRWKKRRDRIWGKSNFIVEQFEYNAKYKLM
jgi:hypothetical protein